MQEQETKPKLRDDLTPAERERALKIGRTDFRSAGATRKRGGAPATYNLQAVNAAIASSNRAGRRIGRGEAKCIHALLKGRC